MSIFLPSDAARVEVPGFPMNLPKYLEDVTLTKGLWEFTFENVTGSIASHGERIASACLVDGIKKKIAVNGWTYHADKNKLLSNVDIIDNPIPIILVAYAVGMVIVGITGAVVVNSVLTDVKQVVSSTDETVVDTVAGLAKSPLIWGALGLVGASIFLRGK